MSESQNHLASRALPQPKEGRLLFIDNLKAALTVLVVLHHLVFFAIVDGVFAPSSLAFGIGNMFLALNQSFFMGLFFLISGYFVPPSFARNGAARFIADRILRFFIPWVFYVFILSPFQSIAAYTMNREPFSWETYLSHLTYGPMWYVLLLFLFVCIYAIWAKWTNTRVRAEDRQNKPPTYAMLAAFAILLATAYFTIRLWIPELGLPGGAPAVRSIVAFFTPSGYDLPQYVGLFIMGILAYRGNWFRMIPGSMGRAGFGTAAGASMLLLPTALIFGSQHYRFSGGWNWTSLVYSLWGALFCVGISLGLITWFRKRFSRQGKGWRFLSAHAFTIYIIHIPVITMIMAALEALPVSQAFVFPATVAAAIPLCFLLANGIRRLPFMARVL